jgi:hypothetical protein
MGRISQIKRARVCWSLAKPFAAATPANFAHFAPMGDFSIDLAFFFPDDARHDQAQPK